MLSIDCPHVTASHPSTPSRIVEAKRRNRVTKAFNARRLKVHRLFKRERPSRLRKGSQVAREDILITVIVGEVEVWRCLRERQTLHLRFSHRICNETAAQSTPTQTQPTNIQPQQAFTQPRPAHIQSSPPQPTEPQPTRTTRSQTQTSPVGPSSNLCFFCGTGQSKAPCKDPFCARYRGAR
jgi:hypothetical protein